MKIWGLCIPGMLLSGLCIGLFLGGCGDNPCDRGDPDTCAIIPNAAANTCMVIEEDDFACLCCTERTTPEGEERGKDECEAFHVEGEWNEITHECELVPI